MKNLNIQSLKSRQPVKVFPDQDKRTNTGQCAEQALFGCNIQDERVRIVLVQLNVKSPIINWLSSQTQVVKKKEQP